MVLYGNAPHSTIVTIVIVMPVLAATFTTLRLYARVVVSKNAGWDDGLIFVSMLASIATTITMIVQADNGMGQHQWTIEPHEAKLMLKAYWAMIVVYNISLTFTKLSILSQYLRIFPQRGLRIATWTLIGVVVIYAVWRFFSAIFTCVPAAAFWDHSIRHKHCQSRFALSMASTSLNMVTDLAIASLPLPFLNKLQLPRRQRWALMAVFALAGFVVVISILRFPSLFVLTRSKDISYLNPMAAIWSCIEINTGIICSCLPTLRCLFPRIFKSASAYGGSGGSSRERKSTAYSSYRHNRRSASFGGKKFVDLSTNVSSPSATHHKAQRSRGGGDDTLLDDTDEIELRSDVQPPRYDYPGKIMVQTEIEQVEDIERAERKGVDMV